MRAVFALLGGVAISITGLGLVLDTAWELAGVALIISGVAVAARGMRAVASDGPDNRSRVSGAGVAEGRSSIVSWPSGLGSRLARRGSGRPKAD
jgi:membrane protein implicated in regulation of membrane protease activity